MTQKKGGLEIRYIVLAAIALLVLVVITLIFFGGVTEFSTKIKELLNSIWDMKPKLQ